MSADNPIRVCAHSMRMDASMWFLETISYRDVWRGLASQPGPVVARCSVHTIVALGRREVEAAIDGIASRDSRDSSR